jgi:hypothetical protein
MTGAAFVAAVLAGFWRIWFLRLQRLQFARYTGLQGVFEVIVQWGIFRAVDVFANLSTSGSRPDNCCTTTVSGAGAAVLGLPTKYCASHARAVASPAFAAATVALTTSRQSSNGTASSSTPM